MGFVISTVNMKGGVGKTTLTVNLASCLAKNHGKRVLVLDLDSQISATLSLMSPHEFAKVRKGQYTLSYLINALIKPNITETLKLEEFICQDVAEVKGMDLLPGDLELYDDYLISQTLHEQAMLSRKSDFNAVWQQFEQGLIRTILSPLRSEYDFIIMDCAPGYNLLTRSGIAASDFYLLPARPEPLSIVGIQLLQRRIAQLKASHADTETAKLKLLGIVFILSGGLLFNRYYNQVMKRVTEDFPPDMLFINSIPMDVNVAKAVDIFKPVVLSKPNSSGAKAFCQLAQELLAKLYSNSQ